MILAICHLPPAKWAGRCSNPSLLVFSQTLYRLSYQPADMVFSGPPDAKKPGVLLVTPGCCKLAIAIADVTCVWASPVHNPNLEDSESVGSDSGTHPDS